MHAFLQTRGHCLLAHRNPPSDRNVLGVKISMPLQPEVRRASAASRAAQQQLASADSTTPVPAKRPNAAQTAPSGYIIAPTRSELPTTAVPDVIQPINRSPQQQHYSISAARRTQQPQPAADATDHIDSSKASFNQQFLQHARKKPQPKTSSFQAQQQETAGLSSNTANDSSSSLHRRRGYDPAKAFMRAGIPSGLWVLPLAASADAPPAPPPVAPDDPAELLKVLQSMPPPRRRLVIFKAGGYIYSDMEALISESGLGHVLRLTNLIRKAHCVLAKPVWDNGRHVNLKQHQAAATKARVPFLMIDKLDAVQLVEAVRLALIRKRIIVGPAGLLGADQQP